MPLFNNVDHQPVINNTKPTTSQAHVANINNKSSVKEIESAVMLHCQIFNFQKQNVIQNYFTGTRFSSRKKKDHKV